MKMSCSMNIFTYKILNQSNHDNLTYKFKEREFEIYNQHNHYGWNNTIKYYKYNF